MLKKIIQFSIENKLIVFLLSLGIVGFGLFSLSKIPIGAVPDITNNQVQIITTSRNLATEDVEKFLTYPIELEMANLPEVKEIRSISKFGLSVVTVIFNDEVGSYIPRQLIAEKIKVAEEKIPTGFGKPFMGPITTGLGEIYQYTVEVDSAYKSKYTLADIRTIQDWIIKRKLSGIPGVVEINTWGGELKQYEVAIHPEKMRSLNISVNEIFAALEKNNSIVGGGYIEKINQSYFVRGEGLINTLADIENIVIVLRGNTPIYIKDVAKVGFGAATRFGAITGNGEGEKVLGQIIMLKGSNSKNVIQSVKERVAKIASTLPPGIKINPFLERSELIDKTTFTIAENLILGCLIVIFVVVLLLGNFRSGLVLASVIPMCLLFALSLMYIFDVDANLMSLGAIDFGIIIDGAVIIVDYIAFKITAERAQILGLPYKQKQQLKDEITQKGASKMMHSAVFGQLIIIIVFIPILTLVGVEGKMFKPMALVFCFALIGAMLLCFTYVPVMASIFIQPSDLNKPILSNRLIQFLQLKYKLYLVWALRKKQLVLALAATLFVSVIMLFTQMGGEFVPTLDEGDFVIQPILKTGTTISNTVKTTTKIEQILKQFPEVKQVVSRIGAAEVPTDPMSMEESDIIIKLVPKNQWVSADSKDELADKFKEALTQIPGIDFEFTQPIEMRFNELITGVRADLAIKIFGEDLDVLYKNAIEIEKAIQNVNGAADVVVEKIVGLPQMTVKYDRAKIAKYGLNIDDLNQLITIGFAGKTTGSVFEGEKQFDLVVRLDKAYRQNLKDLETTTIQLPNGNQLPLSEFATIQHTKGPAKISRDNTKRRIVIGVNVRGRDLESVMLEIEKIINNKIKLPNGYNIEYGGQFENLKTAKNRLLIVVPIALILIFILLYFAFNSVKEALIIFSAIPLSALGGVIFLYLRDLPFSISAGVGFIALFGIAVLNGIVLIEEFKELKDKGILNVNRRVIIGTSNRLRPVLLTASAAALGFLPMAISSSAGAEVQKPLATVVIGGLVSATILTLFVLPILYILFENKKVKILQSKSTFIVAFILIFPFLGKAQNNNLSINQAIDIALEKNLGLKASAERIEQNKQLHNSAFDISKTEIYFNKDLNNIAPNGLALNVVGINQSFQFPTVYEYQYKIVKAKSTLLNNRYSIEKQIIIQQVSKAYNEILYWKQMNKNVLFLDSLYGNFQNAATKRFNLGESNYLEKLTADTKKKEISLHLNQINESLKSAYLNLNQWMQLDSVFYIAESPLIKLEITNLDTINHPVLQYYQNAIKINEYQFSLEKHRLLPDLNTTVFRGTNNGNGVKSYSGFQVGITVPLWYGSQASKINATKTGLHILNYENDNFKRQLISKYNILLSKLKQFEETILYYETIGNKLASETVFHATKAYQYGEINFLQYTQLLDNVKSIESNYLTALFQYNYTVLELNYLMN